MFRLFLLVVVSSPLTLFAQLAQPCPVAEEVDSLIQLSRAFTNNWELDTAYVLSEQAAILARTQCGEGSASYGAACFNEGRVRHFAGEYEAAIPYYQQSLDIRAAMLGQDHLEYGKSLNNLAIVHDLLGQYEKAEWLYLQALALRKRALGRNSRPYSSVLGNLASMYTNKGDYEKAEKLLLETLQIRAEVAGDSSLTYAAGLQNLGELYYQLRLDKEAENYLRQSQAIYQQQGATRSAEYQFLLSALGNLYYSSDQAAQALNYYQQAQEIAATLYGKDHPKYASVLNQLALVNTELKFWEQAQSNWQEALSILDEGSVNYGFFAQNLQRLYHLTEDYQQAEVWAAKVHEILSDHLSPTHSRWIHHLLMLGELKWQQGKLVAAAEHFSELAKNERQNVSAATRHLTERELTTYIDDVKTNHNYHLSLAHKLPAFASVAYEEAVFYKGYVLQSSQRARRIGLNDQRLRDDYQALLALHRRLATEYAYPLEEQYGTEKLEAQVRDLEKALRRRSADLATAWEQPSLSNIQRALSKEEVALEFMHYQQRTPSLTDTFLYSALLLAPGMSHPQLVPLCTKAELEAVLRESEPDLLYHSQAKGAALYQLLWAPLQDAIDQLEQQPKTIYYANSGLLHRIQLAAIPQPAGGVVCDTYQLRTLGSTRQLANDAPPQVRPQADNKPTALLYGGIDYQLDTNQLTVAVDPQETLTPLQRTQNLRGLGPTDHWQPLPWTEVEVSLAQETLTQQGYTTRVRMGVAATEDQLKQELSSNTVDPSPHILHLATHAYFTTKATQAGTNSFTTSQEPLMRSGLILAGGNYAWEQGQPWQSDMEDGILTAYELSQLDLAETELVILSACETGLGSIADLEGVFGLQRACKIAGAHYVLMSLWEIPDFQTQAFMTSFYDYYLSEKLSIPDAFRAAQADMRQQFDSVRAWAGLILLE